MVATRLSNSIGLASNSSHPVAMAFSRSLSTACADTPMIEPSLGGKWLATLKEIAPATVRAALMVNPDITFLQGRTYVPTFESAAAALSVEPVTAHVRSTGDIEAALDSLGQRPGGGLIVVPESFTETHREL